jgi:hypothetical protein
MNLSREFQKLSDKRLKDRGNKMYQDLFRKSIHSVRQFSSTSSDAKGAYRFLQNENVSEENIVKNLQMNCISGCRGKFVVCIQDTSEINLSSHRQRIRHDEFIGTTNAKSDKGLGFLIHPSLVLDAQTGIPYGYSAVKIWNRSLEFKNKFERQYHKLPIEEKDSYKWIEVSKQTQETIEDVVKGMVIIQDREGDIYEQFATIPNEKTDLLIRARTNRTLNDKTKLFSCLEGSASQGEYEILVNSCAKTKRKKRVAKLEVRYKEVEIKRTRGANENTPKTTKLYLVEAKEVGYTGKDKICWRILTTLPVDSITMAMNCIEWYSWRWTIEEVFKILKKEGFNIEASELESAKSVRKLCLMIMEVAIKLFLMRIAYDQPELDIEADACFSVEEQECLEYQIEKLEGKTEKLKNPYKEKDLKRYVWCIARMGGWKGYAKERKPGITTLWLGLKSFKSLTEGWDLHKDVSTR